MKEGHKKPRPLGRGAVTVRTYTKADLPLGPHDETFDYPGVFLSRGSGNKAWVWIKPGTMPLSSYIAPFEPKVPELRGEICINLIHIKLLPGAPDVDLTRCEECQTIVAILDGACGGSMPGQKIACKHANVKPFLGGATYLVGDEFVTPGQEDSLGPWTGGTNWP